MRMRTRPSLAASSVFPSVEGRAFLFGRVLYALLIAASACSPVPGGQESRRSSVPPRVVSLLPAATEVLVALEASDHLVARTDYDQDSRLHALPNLGRTLEPSAETLLALDPDLVILPAFVQAQIQLLRLFQDRDIEVLRPRLHSIADLYSLIDTLGVLLNEQTRGQQLRAGIQRELEAVRSAARSDGVRALFVVWPEPPRVAANHTFVQEIMEVAGARNVVADLEGWPELSLEEILRRDPDLILLPTGDGQGITTEWLARQPGWREVRAVRTGRVFAVHTDLFNRPGPQVGEAARVLARALQSTQRAAR
jgi:cobalamin transport system substrate-binding protein